MKSQICKNCINFIYENSKDIVSCDYEHWDNVNIYQAILYTPIMYGCVNFEYCLELKD